jgi:hypothetical protein
MATHTAPSTPGAFVGAVPPVAARLVSPFPEWVFVVQMPL